MDFMQSQLWWILFCVMGLSMFLMQFGRLANTLVSCSLYLLYGFAGIVIIALAFLLIGWQAGIAMIVSCLVWAIAATILFTLLLRVIKK